MFDEFDPPLLRAILPMGMIVCGALALYFTSTREPTEAPPQDAMDGVYENAECPGFTISDGALRFDGATIPGTIGQGKSSLYFETAQSLRYEMGPGGCRLVVAEPGALIHAERKAFASPVIMIQLFSVDRARGMYWTRTGPPVAVPDIAQTHGSTP
jgi:hypothetical protein